MFILTSNTRESLANLLPFFIILISVIISLFLHIPISSLMKDFQYNIIVILVVMELFTNLITRTRIMKYIAIKLAKFSRGNSRNILLSFTLLMFCVSPLMNNITAVLVIIPVILTLLKAIKSTIDSRFVYIFFACLLAVCNTGGAASPIGDFPAIIIMTSGITTFGDYLVRAMPLFLLTSVILVLFWLLKIPKGKDNESEVAYYATAMKGISYDRSTLIMLSIIFLGMFIAWSFIPQSIIPPELIAVLGYVVAIAICKTKEKMKSLNKEIESIEETTKFSINGILTIASFLFLASVVSATGWLSQIAGFLEGNISDPLVLLMLIMLITSLMSGLFSAGPAAAAMMPVIVNLCNGTFSSQSHWVAIAYAASICAGSSLFLWSATAGFVVSNKIDESSLGYRYGITQYFKFGILNYLIQISIALISIYLIFKYFIQV